MSEKALSVTELNTYIHNVFNNDPLLMNVKLVGELRDVKKSLAGHFYFSVIDENSSISGSLFHFNVRNLNGYIPKDGDQVEIIGDVNVYIKSGRYSINVKRMGLAGEGAKLLALKKLTEKLSKEGLFTLHKRPINLFPRSIGIITAKNSAAYMDLVTNLYRRYPLVNIYVFYSSVQGSEASKELINALKKAYDFSPRLDTLIISRGGGSNEDLDVFNNEEVVRVAATSSIPLIAAIGHEIDFTLIEYVADKRASTPTGAAELATIDKREIYDLLDHKYDIMLTTLNNKIGYLKDKLFNLSNRPFFINPKSIYQNTLQELKFKKEQLFNIIKMYLTNKRSDLKGINEKLLALNPSQVLNRGFTILRGKNGKIIKNVDDVSEGDELESTLKNGKIYANVTKKEKHV